MMARRNYKRELDECRQVMSDLLEDRGVNLEVLCREQVQEAAEKAEQEVVALLYRNTEDDYIPVLDGIVNAAGLIWTCTAHHCGYQNYRTDEVCGDCGAGRP